MIQTTVTEKKMKTYFTKLFNTGATYVDIAKEMNRTPFRLKRGEKWSLSSANYFGTQVLGLKRYPKTKIRKVKRSIK